VVVFFRKNQSGPGIRDRSDNQNKENFRRSGQGTTPVNLNVAPQGNSRQHSMFLERRAGNSPELRQRLFAAEVESKGQFVRTARSVGEF